MVQFTPENADFLVFEVEHLNFHLWAIKHFFHLNFFWNF